MTDSLNVQELRSYLHLKARVTVTDGRMFCGTFTCVDKQKNIILANSDEFRKGEKRHVGLVMIPGKHITKAEVEDVDALDRYT